MSATKRFHWNSRQMKAAMLIAEGELTDVKIADKLKLALRTLGYWKAHPDFQYRIAVYEAEANKRILKEGFADKVKRIQVLSALVDKHCAVIEERARQPAMANVPGGKTGLIVARPRIIITTKLDKNGRPYDSRDVYTDYRIDFSIGAGLRANLRAIAKESAISSEGDGRE